MSDEKPESDDQISEDVDNDQEGGDDSSRLKKIILIVLVSTLIIAGIIGGLWVSGIFGDSETTAENGQEENETAAEGQAETEPERSGVFYEMPQMLVNLASTGRRASFLKIALSLELEGPEDLLLIEQTLPRITDTLQVYLRELRPEDLKGSSGIHRLREELLLRLDTSSAPVKVLDILFKEILIQ